jgi:hypothetical protein
MVSIGPYCQITDFTHMWDKRDIRPPPGYQKPELTPNNSIYSMINSNPDFTVFSYIIRVANMEMFYYNDIGNYTVFVPSDRYLKERNISERFLLKMDKSTAIQICNYCTLYNSIKQNVLTSNPIVYLTSMNKNSQLLISNNREKTMIDEYIEIIYFDIECTNGILHVIDGLPLPYFL